MHARLPSHLHPSSPLHSTALHDRRRTILVLDPATAGTARLNALDDADARRVAGRHLPEDNVARVEPGGDDGGDEELAAIGVGAGVGHAEHEGLVVREFEVLVRELLAVDGLAAGAL